MSRRTINPKNWERNKKKEARSKKDLTIVSQCCTYRCYTNVNREEQLSLFNHFWGNSTKHSQDEILASFMRHSAPKQNTHGRRKNTWHYFVNVGNSIDIQVCQTFIRKLFNVSEKRIRILQRKILSDASFEELRGKHGQQWNKYDETVYVLLQAHLSLFPSELSHYKREGSSLRYFCNPNLTKKKLFVLFKKFYQEKTGDRLRMAYNTYVQIFNKKTRYAFRRPRVDVCDFCREKKMILSADPKNKEAKIKLLLHERKVAKYKSIKQYCLSNDNREMMCCFEFDYAQNLALPKLNVTMQFYKRLLWLYVFNIHSHADNNSILYTYLENEGPKDSNSVVSFLFHYLSKKLKEPQFENVNECILFSDAAGSQNKNSTMCRFLSWFASVTNKTFEQIFPVRGHSYNQNDRNFGLYGAKIKKKECITHYKKYLEIMSCARDPPFDILKDSSVIKNFKESLAAIFETEKPVFVGPGKKLFKIQQYVRMKYFPNGEVHASPTYQASYSKFIYKRRPNALVHLKKVEPPGLKNSKKKDLQALLSFMKQSNRQWLEDIIM